LERRRCVLDLVEEDRAAIGDLEQPRMIRGRPRERRFRAARMARYACGT
jgi:hypothetical protein